MEKKSKKNNFNLKEEYKKSWNYIKESRNFIYIIIGIFFVFALIGFFIPASDVLKEQILKLIQGLIEEIQGMSQGELINFIEGILVLWRLLPHGIFELPAIFISLGLGLKLGTSLISAKDKGKGILAFIISFFSFVFISLFLISSIIIFSFFWISITFLSNNLILNFAQSFLFLSLILISFVLSIFLGITILSKSDKKLVLNNSKKYFWNSLRVFLFIVIPLLIIAGIIEGSLMFMFG